MSDFPFGEKIKNVVIGGARDPHEPSTFRKLSLVTFFAWIGLGADGLSSSCYGPSEAYKALLTYPHLSIFVALASAITIFVIASSYSQIIELFPTGGGGYLVASKLLTPGLGMVSGCALMVDYVLTISVSIVAGADAMFSFFPPEWLQYKLVGALLVVAVMMLMNLRGVRESVALLAPIFLIFIFTHAFIIVYAMIDHGGQLDDIAIATSTDTGNAVKNLGWFGMLWLLMHAYSMGAGTYTGIEAVSNGMPILREPKVRTAKRTMTCMWISLAVTVVGLMVAYLLYQVGIVKGKTPNAVLLGNITESWSWGGPTFVIVTLISEAALLFVAAQTGFLGGPRVLASMAQDRWFPTRFSMLSDRLVTQNGVVLMAVAAGIIMWATNGSVEMLIVLYAINVFITFTLSQTGMVLHWIKCPKTTPHWKKKLFINGVGLVLTVMILMWLIVIKFFEGGWITLLITSSLITLAILIKVHYNRCKMYLDKFNTLAIAAVKLPSVIGAGQDVSPISKPDPSGKTAVLLVNGFNGMGIHLLMNISRFFGDAFKNFIFLQVGVIDAANYKGVAELGHLKEHIQLESEKYVQLVAKQGYFATARTSVGADVVDEVNALAHQIVEEFPAAVFFTGQLMFPNDTVLTRMLHNNISFALQRKLYQQGMAFMMLPIRVQP